MAYPTHVATAAGAQTLYTSGTPTSHSVTKPASATSGTYVIVELGLKVDPPSTTGTVGLITSVPAGWTMLAEGWVSGSPSSRYAAYGKFMGSSEPASWSWSYAANSDTVSVTHVFSNVHLTTPVPERGWLAQAASGTTRVTPSITTAGDRYVFYSTNDRNASDPVVADATENGTKVRNSIASSAQVTTFRAGNLVAGTYSRTMTGAASTANAGSAIFALKVADPINVVPTSGAGTDQSNLEPWATVTLTGTDADSDGTVVTRVWRQISGTTVTLTGTGTTRTYTAPATLAGATLVFGYQVTDDLGGVSVEDTVSHTILAVTERAVVGGVEVPVRFQAVGLD